jgi:hypothetical protein
LPDLVGEGSGLPAVPQPPHVGGFRPAGVASPASVTAVHRFL